MIADLGVLSLKTALLLFLTLVKRIGDLQAFSVDASCLEFGPKGNKVSLEPRHGYVPRCFPHPLRHKSSALCSPLYLR